MLETPHVVVAVAIAYKIPDPTISLPLVFVSHFVFDLYPHWNPHIHKEKRLYGKITDSSMRIIKLDVILALIVGSIGASLVLPDINHFIWIMSACFIVVIPDLVAAPFYIFNRKNGFQKKWVNFKRSIQTDISMFWGLISQAVVLFAALFWIMS